MLSIEVFEGGGVESRSIVLTNNQVRRILHRTGLGKGENRVEKALFLFQERVAELQVFTQTSVILRIKCWL